MYLRVFNAIQRFFIWWGSELFALFPKALKHQLSGSKNTLLVRLTPEGMEAVWLSNKDSIHLGTYPLDDNGRVAFLNKVAEYSAINNAKCVLVLSDCQYIKKHILLPKQAISNVREVIGFELDRYTPFNIENAFFDMVRSDISNDNKVGVNLAVTSRALLEGILKDVSAFKLLPSKVTFSKNMDLPLDGEGFNLLPSNMWPKTKKKEPLLIAALVIILLLQLIATVTYPNQRAQQEVATLQHEIKLIQKDVRRVSDMRFSVEKAHSQLNAFLGQAANKPFVVDIMKHLSERLPTSTWLTRLQLNGNQLNIQGYSNDAAGLIQRLDDSPLFKNTRFTSPLTNNKSSQQAFKIGLNIVNRGADVSAINN